MDLTILETTFICPRCKGKTKVIIEHAEKDRIKCYTCAVYFHRIGWSYCFKSADGKKIFVSEAQRKAGNLVPPAPRSSTTANVRAPDYDR